MNIYLVGGTVRDKLLNKHTVFFWLTFWLTLPAWACRYDVDIVNKLPLAERLKAVPVAFIGTVSRVTLNGTVEFHVEHLLRGEVEGKRFVFKSGKSSCDLKFLVNQRWLFGGTTLFHPSVLLDERGQSGQYLKRLNDSKLKFPMKWQTCHADVECSTLIYGCTRTAVNKRYLDISTEKAWRIGGDPRTLNCVRNFNEFAHPMCVQRMCGMWQLQNNN